MADTTNELFDAIKLIADEAVRKNKSTSVIVGKVFEYIKASGTYKVSYQGIEILASSLGGVYNIGDEVYVMLPTGTLDGNKFIIGRTNSRIPTISVDGDKLSDDTLNMIQNIIDSMNDMTSDDVLTPNEKQNLALQWASIKKSYDDVINQAKAYPEVDLSALKTKMNTINTTIIPLLENMEESSNINGAAMRQMIGEYFSEDSAVRLILQELLRKELLYKITIVSSNGNTFKNGVIDTTFNIIVMQGRNEKTSEITDAQVIWKKLNSDGSEISTWEKTGKELKITSADVSVKEVFSVKLIVEETVVARDMITIVDLNDIENIVLTLTTTLPRVQTYYPETNKVIPDYRETPQNLQAVVMKGRSDKTADSNYYWYLDGEEIKANDARFTINKNILTIKANITDSEKPSAKISCKATYYSLEYNMLLEHIQEFDFNYVSNGEEGLDALILNFITPYGTVIKNKNINQLLVDLKAYHGDKDVSNSLITRKWFYNDKDITSESEFYDADAGVGWSLIKPGNDLSGNIINYDKNNLTISGDGFNGSITLKVIIYYGEQKSTADITLIDVTDPLNVVILGNPLIKQNESTKLSVKLFRGDLEIADVGVYTLEWNMELVNPVGQARSGDASISLTWPKYGPEVELLWEELPSNDDIYITCRIYEE